MSRDLTPRELDTIQKRMNMPNIVDDLVLVNADGTESPAYSNEDKILSHRYPKLGMFGFDMLSECRDNGVFDSKIGCEIVQQIEDHFNGKEISDIDLRNKVIAWYDGTLQPGHYMTENTQAMADYITNLTKAKSKNMNVSNYYDNDTKSRFSAMLPEIAHMQYDFDYYGSMDSLNETLTNGEDPVVAIQEQMKSEYRMSDGRIDMSKLCKDMIFHYDGEELDTEENSLMHRIKTVYGTMFCKGSLPYEDDMKLSDLSNEDSTVLMAVKDECDVFAMDSGKTVDTANVETVKDLRKALSPTIKSMIKTDKFLSDCIKKDNIDIAKFNQSRLQRGSELNIEEESSANKDYGMEGL